MTRRTENLLLEEAEDLGWAGIRVDIRGSAGYTSGHDAGDLIIGRRAPGLDNIGETLSDLRIIEEKYRSSDAKLYIQLDREKIEAMIDFAEQMGAIPLIACRWSTNLDVPCEATHYIADAREVDLGDGQTFSISPSVAVEKYPDAYQYFSESKVGGF